MLCYNAWATPYKQLAPGKPPGGLGRHAMLENTLYYGDSLDILREHVHDESPHDSDEHESAP